MGSINHHAIIVTHWDKAELKSAHKIAKEIFGKNQVSKIMPAMINHYCSFFIGPDGSREGWAISREGDARREQFVFWLRTRQESDGSNSFCYAEMQYGGGETKIVNDSDSDYRYNPSQIEYLKPVSKEV